MSSSLLFHAASYFLYVTICPATLMLFSLRRVSGPSSRFTSTKTTDFYATLMFGVFTTLTGVFGLVAQSASVANSRWWSSASYAMQTLAILIAQLAVLQLLTPDYLYVLLSIASPPNGVPPRRIYAIILMTIISSVASLVSVFLVPQTPSLPSSLPTFVTLCLPLPLLFSLSRIVKCARLNSRNELPATTIYTKRSSKCTELGLIALDGEPIPVDLRFPRVWDITFILQCIAALAAMCEVVEGGLGRQISELRLLTSMGIVAWGGGVMTVHFVIIYEPTYRSPMVPIDPVARRDLERVIDQPSEDFMTLKDPFASPTQVGVPLPPSPSAPRRKPRRRASEPLHLTRFGSFAGLVEDVKEKQAGTEVDQDTQFLEALVRHALFSTGRADSDSTRNNSHADKHSDSTQYRPVEVIAHDPSTSSDTFGAPCTSGSSTPTIKQGSACASGVTQVPALLWHPFRPTTPPKQSRTSSRTSQRLLAFPDPPSSFPLSSASDCSLSPAVPAPPSAYKPPPSPASSDSGSSFVSPPPTPTPGPSRQTSQRKVRTLGPARPAPALSQSLVQRRGSTAT